MLKGELYKADNMDSIKRYVYSLLKENDVNFEQQ